MSSSTGQWEVPSSIVASSDNKAFYDYSSSASSIVQNSAAAGLPVQDLLEAYLQNPAQRTLDVSGIELYEMNIASILTTVRTKKLTTKGFVLDSLIAQRCKLNEKRTMKLLQGLEEEKIQVSRFDLSSNKIDSAKSLQALLRCNAVEHLNLSHNRLGDRGIDNLMSALAKNKSLASLNLSHNQIWTIPESAFTVLSSHPSLQVLDIERNFVRDAGVVLLAKAISFNVRSPLTTLNLGNNAFGDVGARALAEMLVQNHSLVAVDVSRNEIGDEGASALHGVLVAQQNKALQELSGLNSNRIESAELISAIEILLQQRGKALSLHTPKNQMHEIDGESKTDDSTILSTSTLDDHSIGSGSQSGTFPKLDSLLPLPSIEQAGFRDADGAWDRPATFRNAISALDLASRTPQHERMLVRTEANDVAAVCLANKGGYEGVEMVAVPLEAASGWARIRSGKKQSRFAATEAAIEVLLDPDLTDSDSLSVGKDDESYSDGPANHDDTLSTTEPSDLVKVPPRHRLTLFQASPISFLDRKTNKRHMFPVLDFAQESNAIQQALKDAEAVGTRIEIEREIATTDRLSAFFAQGGRRLLHLSCHGHPEWLALENGFGEMQPLFVQDLRNFVQAGGTSLDLVFVSACHSLSAGQAFLEAGVKHVVCAKQNTLFRDEACAEFARSFYRALACGKTLKGAFNMAKQAVRYVLLIE